MAAAAALGIAAYKSISNDDYDEEIEIKDVNRPTESNAPISPTTVYVQAPPQQPLLVDKNQTITIPPPGKGVSVGVVDSVVTERKRKRRRRPKTVQIRDRFGQFTSKTVKRKTQKRDKDGRFK